MSRKPKKSPREKDLTSRYLSGGMDEDSIDQNQRFTDKNKNMQRNKTAKTAQMRQDARDAAPDVDALPVGRVVQVFSLFCEVVHDGTAYLCTIRKTLNKVSSTGVVVGDFVRFRPSAKLHESGKPEGVVEGVETRRTVLTRSDSFKQQNEHPVVANADQMLIVASAANPKPKWGLIDRLLIAARSGGLEAILCLNKTDLADQTADDDAGDVTDVEPILDDEYLAEPATVTPEPLDALAYYESIGTKVLRTSVNANVGLDELTAVLKDKITVLAGHSGVGKSSLIRAIQPSLDIRVGDVSEFTEKGRHTTTSARYYPLDIGGAVVDTPGVKVFGLWNVTRDNLLEFFPDVEEEIAPAWRRESYERIAESVKG